MNKQVKPIYRQTGNHKFTVQNNTNAAYFIPVSAQIHQQLKLNNDFNAIYRDKGTHPGGPHKFLTNVADSDIDRMKSTVKYPIVIRPAYKRNGELLPGHSALFHKP
jgi:hypothetical protein